MSELKDIILEFKDFFEKTSDEAWLNHVKKTLEIIEMDESRGYEFVNQSYFGGSGTLSDIRISAGNGHKWPNDDFDEANLVLKKIGSKLYRIAYVEEEDNGGILLSLKSFCKILFRT